MGDYVGFELGFESFDILIELSDISLIVCFHQGNKESILSSSETLENFKFELEKSE